MKLTDQLTDYVHAAFSGLCVQSSEPDEAEREIVQLARQRNWKVAVWDVANGLRLPNAHADRRPTPPPATRWPPCVPCPPWPNATARRCCCSTTSTASCNNPEVIQTTFTQLVAGKQQRTFLVVLSPRRADPRRAGEAVRRHRARPARPRPAGTHRPRADQRQPDDLPQGDDLQRVLDAAAGLTRYEAEGAFALSLTRHNAMRPEAIWELKAQTLKKNNLLTLHRGGERFDALGGLANLKDFCRRALRPGRHRQAPRHPPLRGPRSRKIGVRQGAGQRGRAADAAARRRRPDGQPRRADARANVRQALRIADAMSPCDPVRATRWRRP